MFKTKNEMIMEVVAKELTDFIINEREEESISDEQYIFLEKLMFMLKNKEL